MIRRAGAELETELVTRGEIKEDDDAGAMYTMIHDSCPAQVTRLMHIPGIG